MNLDTCLCSGHRDYLNFTGVIECPNNQIILYFLVARLTAIFLQLWWDFLWIFLTMSHSVSYRKTPLELTFSQLLFGAIALMSFVLFYILDFTLIPSFGIDLRCCTHVGQFAVDHRLYVGTLQQDRPPCLFIDYFCDAHWFLGLWMLAKRNCLFWNECDRYMRCVIGNLTDRPHFAARLKTNNS